jgi:hypothetical protein
MAASAAATGAASCVSSVSKMKDAERFTGSLGLKSHAALLVVVGMLVPFSDCVFVCGSSLLRRGQFVAVRRPSVVALPAQARETAAEFAGDRRRKPGVDVFQAALPSISARGFV